MELGKINLKMENLSGGGPAILQGVAPAHPYRDGRPIMEEIIGRKVTVVFPDNHYERLTVTVTDPTDALSPLLAKATGENPVYVAFDDFSATIYVMRDRVGISAKASAVRVVTKEENGIDLDSYLDDMN